MLLGGVHKERGQGQLSDECEEGERLREDIHFEIRNVWYMIGASKYIHIQNLDRNSSTYPMFKRRAHLDLFKVA